MAYQKDPSKKHTSANKYEARLQVRIAVLEGHLKKPSKCSMCGEHKPRHKIHGHHTNYNHPLRVKWVCEECHAMIHQ